MVGSAAKPPRRPSTRGLLSAQSNPAWLNQATVKGTILVLAGASMTVTTRNTDRYVPLILGVLLVAWAASELWFRVVRRAAPRDLAGLTFPLALLVAGVVLIADPGPALSVILGVALVSRAAILVVGNWNSSRTRHRRAPLVRVVTIFVVGVVMIALPESLILGVRALAGGLAVVVGGILLARGLRPENKDELLELDARGAGTLTRGWLRSQRLDAARIEEISAGLFYEQPRRGAKLVSFWVMTSLATSIATFAVIQDSTAVVIGAMLIAPLMTPIVGIAAGMMSGWPGRMITSLVLVAAAVVVSIFLAWTIAAWLPSVGDLTTNSQITSRTQPNMIDFCIAIVAGAAGAYATVDPRVSNSLPGVAIAVALVPPLAVVGVTLEAGMTGDALGAFLLFATNLVSIILAGSVVLVLTGFARLSFGSEERERRWRVLGPLVLGMVLMIVPLSITSFSAWTDTNNDAAARQAVSGWLGADDDLTLVDLEVDGDSVEMVLTGSDAPPPVGELQTTLDKEFGETVELSVRFIPSEILDS